MEGQAFKGKDENQTNGQTNDRSNEYTDKGQQQPNKITLDLIRSPKLGKEKLATLVMLSLSNFCCGSLASLYGPFFPREAESKGMSTASYGLVFGAYWLTIAVSIPLFGILVCAVPPKLIHWTGVLVLGVCGVLFGTMEMCPAGTPFISLVFAIRIAEGFGVAATKTSMHSILVSQFKEDLASIFTSVETFLVVGLALGPIIGGALCYAEGFSLPFYVMGTVAVICAVCSAFLLPEPEKCQKGDMKKLGQLLKEPRMYVYILMVVTTLAYSGLLLTTLEPHVRQFDLSGVYLGMLFAISCFTYSLTSPAWEWLIEKGMNNLLLTVFASIFIILSLLLIGPATFLHEVLSLKFVIGALFLKGIGTGGKLVCSHYGSLRDAIHRGFPNDDSTHGLITGIYAVSVAAGACVGTSSGGYIYDTIGFTNGAFILIGLEVLTMIVVFVSAFLRKYQRPKRQLLVEQQPILQQPPREEGTTAR